MLAASPFGLKKQSCQPKVEIRGGAPGVIRALRSMVWKVKKGVCGHGQDVESGEGSCGNWSGGITMGFGHPTELWNFSKVIGVN